jgi:molybdenum ABC transporter ATP-binding protein
MAGALTVDIEKRFASGAIVSARFETAIRGGAIVVLFGPSGAGKTTVVRSVAGLEKPDRGTIRFAGDTWFDRDGRWTPPQARRVGYVGQEPALFPHLTVRANVGYGLRGRPTAAGARGSERIDEILALLDLAGLQGRRPHELSGGQTQRAALARALAPEPRLLLLDEPFAALDAPARVRLRSDLRSIVRALGASVVLVTHDRTEAIALGDELVVLAEGRVRQVGPVLDVFRRPADLVVARTVGVESVLPARIERTENGLIDLAVAGRTLRAVDADLDGRPQEVFACIRAEDVTLERAAAPGASARNHLPGRVVSIDSEGPLERVNLDCGFPLVALITRNAREELALAEGVPIVAAIKATAVHLVARS